MTRPAPVPVTTPHGPWPALVALCIGFFMILVDTTIVTVAIPTLMADLGAEVNAVMWVSSAYLLAYAVPLLITGRLGDRFGPKRLYQTGLLVFTVASLWCGLTSSLEFLVTARVFQGFGASMMTPQTMTVITRLFPPERRGQAMALWGAVAGVATISGPLLGGFLLDLAGWEWIFIVNVPVGVVGLLMAARLVPVLPTNQHRFDWLGVVLSGVAMFLLVFGIQEGHAYGWSRISGWVSVPLLLVVGVVVLIIFLVWQAVNRSEPLVPLRLFADRNFSMSNVTITTMAFAATSMGFPFMMYAQMVRGNTPTQAALLTVPMGAMSILMAPIAGRLTDRVHPRTLAGNGFALAAVALYWLSATMRPDSATWQILAAMALFGIATSFTWGPLAAAATRNLPMHQAGAGSGVYNTTRQIGSVMGSAAIAVLIDARLTAHLPGSGGGRAELAGEQLPQVLQAPFSTALAESFWLLVAMMLLGMVSSLFLVRPHHLRAAAPHDA